MKRLLAISWEMPPLSGPRAVQVTRTLMALGERGWRSRAICFDARSERYQQDHLDLARGAIWRRREAAAGALTRGVVVLSRALACLPPLKHLPDEKRVWVPSAIAEGRRTLSDEPADVIVSFGQPWSDHLVGLALRQGTGLPWVAHFSDPWVDSPYQGGNGWTRRRAAAMERNVVAAATRMIFVNRQTLERVMKKYPPAWSQRAHVVPQGHDGTAAKEAASTSSAPLRICYTGRFYDGIRTPESFLRAIAEVDRKSSLAGRVAVEFVGGRMNRYEDSRA